MKKMIVAALTLATASTVVNASDIMLAKNIKSGLRAKIERDLNLIDNFKFNRAASKETLKLMEMTDLNGQSATEWLNNRVSYVISENALSYFNLIVKRVIFVDQKDVIFPNQNVIPYSLDISSGNSNDKANDGPTVKSNDKAEEQEAFTVMSNIGSALYLGGKEARTVYGMKIPRGLFKKAERVAVTSPRAGIIQIGEGLFAPELTINQGNPEALANSIFRLGTFFHEARHSDGNGASLGFLHTNCPKGHDYADQPACDENLNGPYAVGTLMMAEMTKACEASCSDKDKETLRLMVIDSANRILKTTHKGEISKEWDATPESL